MIGGYRAELDAARTRLAASPATVVETAAGPIEYLDVGHGPPVLWVHGVVGGCDQAPRMSQVYLGDGFRIIAVSRFGYLHSRLPADSDVADTLTPSLRHSPATSLAWGVGPPPTGYVRAPLHVGYGQAWWGAG